MPSNQERGGGSNYGGSSSKKTQGQHRGKLAVSKLRKKRSGLLRHSSPRVHDVLSHSMPTILSSSIFSLASGPKKQNKGNPPSIPTDLPLFRYSSSQNNQASSSSASISNSSANKKPRGAQQPKQNTAIYVTGLPPDTTVDEVHELFSRKCGVVAEEIDSGKPRIKLYTDSDGKPKGDALVVFFKPQSVEMAMMLLDDTTFRFGDTTSEPMRIQPADSTYKKTQYAEEGVGEASTSSNTPREGSGSDAVATAGEPEQGSVEKKVRTEKEKAKIKAKAQKMNDKLADWSDDEPYYAEQQQNKQAGRWDKVVILKHMFTLQELDEDPTAILDIKEDIRDECAKLGEVTNVVLFDFEPEGVVSVKFADVDAAEACVNLMDGRNFGGQVVEASIATGKERFKKSKKKVADDSDEENED